MMLFFDKMQLMRERLKPFKTLLVGFSGESVETEEMISLLVTVVSAPHKRSVMLYFIVVNLSSASTSSWDDPRVERFESHCLNPSSPHELSNKPRTRSRRTERRPGDG